MIWYLAPLKCLINVGYHDQEEGEIGWWTSLEIKED